MTRKCGSCKYARKVNLFEICRTDVKDFTGIRCMLSGEWVYPNYLCKLRFDIARKGIWYVSKRFLWLERCECSLCHKKETMKAGKHKAFCPNCGAQMDGQNYGMKRVDIDSCKSKEMWEEITGIELKKEWQLAREKKPEYGKDVLVMNENGLFDRCFLDKDTNYWYKVKQDGEVEPYKKFVCYWLETDFRKVDEGKCIEWRPGVDEDKLNCTIETLKKFNSIIEKGRK